MVWVWSSGMNRSQKILGFNPVQPLGGWSGCFAAATVFVVSQKAFPHLVWGALLFLIMTFVQPLGCLLCSCPNLLTRWLLCVYSLYGPSDSRAGLNILCWKDGPVFRISCSWTWTSWATHISVFHYGAQLSYCH